MEFVDARNGEIHRCGKGLVQDNLECLYKMPRVWGEHLLVPEISGDRDCGAGGAVELGSSAAR